MSLKSFFLQLQVVVFFFLGAPLRAENFNIYFKTSPKVEFLRPDSAPANLSLLITGIDGRPIEQGTVSIRLDAPKPGRIFSTDFPMVEGTSLNEMRLPLQRGLANWKYAFPIRGEYSLVVEAEDADGRKTSKKFSFTVRENRHKWIALGGFSLGLFLLGFVAGRIFSGTSAKALGLVSSMALAAATMTSGESLAQGLAKDIGSARLEIEPATVGKPSRVRWSLSEAGPRAMPMTALTLTITQLEENKVIFAVERVAVAGEFSMKFHFTDGSDHRVTAVAEMPGQAPFKSERVISVTPVEPPMRAMFPALGLFLALIALGLAGGRCSKRRVANLA